MAAHGTLRLRGALLASRWPYAVIALGAVAMLLVFFQKWLAAATVGGIFVIGLFGVPALMRRTEPGELRREAERFVGAWARGMASSSGAWRTHPRRGRSEGNDPTDHAE